MRVRDLVTRRVRWHGALSLDSVIHYADGRGADLFDVSPMRKLPVPPDVDCNQYDLRPDGDH